MHIWVSKFHFLQLSFFDNSPKIATRQKYTFFDILSFLQHIFHKTEIFFRAIPQLHRPKIQNQAIFSRNFTKTPHFRKIHYLCRFMLFLYYFSSLIPTHNNITTATFIVPIILQTDNSRVIFLTDYPFLSRKRIVLL